MPYSINKIQDRQKFHQTNILQTIEKYFSTTQTHVIDRFCIFQNIGESKYVQIELHIKTS